MNLLGEAEIDELTNITESTTREMIELMDKPSACRAAELSRTKRFAERLKIVRKIFETLAPLSVLTRLDLIAPYLREMKRAEKLCEMLWATDAWEEEEQQRLQRIKASRITIGNLRILETTSTPVVQRRRYGEELDDGKQRLAQMTQRISQTKLKVLPPDQDASKQ
ncbi:MAG: hypothetical protein IPP57_22345 [Candidatus Obscuribacter sp.]|jgi:hypothetical protein|nr:hypothetical protein [Candidatus Obscuribacter sp.]MDQ5965902.1 hypothetical protein [Cyanobacteriota bacterium erpe_2018_sw_39hr_WHONDRS-SW48-000098_B_bin.30]MBK7838653.1 hypothetical protein [Candidatus Obscuribacter sp.]MBK9202708.1 hypothetical protein [Candidatus Obscuribacter sp.]MBK9621189.1 hypothetical protein [Candidatus Obscuribacter sp.]